VCENGEVLISAWVAVLQNRIAQPKLKPHLFLGLTWEIKETPKLRSPEKTVSHLSWDRSVFQCKC